MPRFSKSPPLLVILLAFWLAPSVLASQEIRTAGDLTDYETLALALKTGSIKNLLVVDIRTSALFHAGHIPGAINLPLDELWDKVPAKKGVQPTLVLYGRPASSDVRKAADILRSNGFTNVVIFGSITLWKGALQVDPQ